MNPIVLFKRRAFPKGIRRWLRSKSATVIQRTSKKNLISALRELKIPDRAVICIHSALNPFGYISGGPQNVIYAIQEAIPDCTLVMPSFPFTGSMKNYVESGSIYDPVNSLSRAGLLGETLRRMEGSLRSLHPTHACVAIGPMANRLISGTENTQTPFGKKSTYGIYASMDNAYHLLLHTNNTSIVHVFQELIEMPNLFLEGTSEIKGLNWKAEIISYHVRVHRDTIPLYVIMEGKSKKHREYVWWPDYAVLFPQEKVNQFLSLNRSKNAKEIIIRRQKKFIKDGIFQTVKMGRAEIMSISVKQWQKKICNDASRSLIEFADDYKLPNMEAAMRSGFLHH